MPEQELSDVFVRAVGDSVPDLGLLVAGATTEGRSIRLRRRLAFTGATAAVAVLAVGGGLLLRPAAPPSAASATVSAAGPGAVPTAVPPVSNRDVVLELVRELTPAGLSGEGPEVDGAGTVGSPEEGPEVSVLVRFRDASGADAGTVEVLAQRAPRSLGIPPTDCDEPPATDSCDIGGTGDFDSVTVTLPAGNGRPLGYRADLLDRTGLRIVVTSTGLTGGAPPLDRTVVGKLAAVLHQNLFPDSERALALAREKAAAHAASPPASPEPTLTRPAGATGTGDGPGR
ncbi:hypothetical protein [Kitasatospora phosalacinea]|uniref:hypothetical protein n=1 Tax=Kitasatospora phosalacinea TaxID=2065 RepID=UPI00052479BA|nr:hypothetical protein [Kitasatospora phosalacinea]